MVKGVVKIDGRRGEIGGGAYLVVFLVVGWTSSS